jgi:hypothetical protein
MYLCRLQQDKITNQQKEEKCEIYKYMEIK